MSYKKDRLKVLRRRLRRAVVVEALTRHRPFEAWPADQIELFVTWAPTKFDNWVRRTFSRCGKVY